MTKITLDIEVAITDQELGYLLVEGGQDKDVAVTLLGLHGSSNKNPLVRLTGQPHKVYEWLLVEYVDGDVETANFLMADFKIAR